MVRQAVQENVEETYDHNKFEPKMTRSKVKEALETKGNVRHTSYSILNSIYWAEKKIRDMSFMPVLLRVYVTDILICCNVCTYMGI